MHPTLHPSSLPQIGDRVQVKQGVYARRVFIVIGAYSDQVELGDENGNFVYSCSPTIVTVCSSPATQTAPASLPAPADAGQGVGIPHPEKTNEEASGDPEKFRIAAWRRRCNGMAPQPGECRA